MIPRATSVIGLLLAAKAVSAVMADAIPATGPSRELPLISMSDEKRAEKSQFDAMWELPTFPRLPDGPIAKFVTIKSQGRWLAVDCPYYKGYSQTLRFRTGSGGEGSLRLFHDKQVADSRSVIVEVHDFTLPDRVDQYLQLTSVPYVLHIEEHNEFLDRDEAVSLTQRQDVGSPEAVTMRFNVIGDTGTTGSISNAYTAADFWDLRLKHPAEVEKYLRPMFRDFGMEPEVFAVGNKAAWQVVRDQWTAPTGLAEKVRGIVARLDADDYDARAAAQADLEKLGQPAALVLLSAKLSDLSAEQSARVQKFLAAYHPLTEEQAANFRQDANFLLDCLYSDDADLRRAAAKDLASLNRQIDIASLKIDASAEERCAGIRQVRDGLFSSTAATRAQGK
jgi:hypothetical protein